MLPGGKVQLIILCIIVWSQVGCQNQIFSISCEFKVQHWNEEHMRLSPFPLPLEENWNLFSLLWKTYPANTVYPISSRVPVWLKRTIWWYPLSLHLREEHECSVVKCISCVVCLTLSLNRILEFREQFPHEVPQFTEINTTGFNCRNQHLQDSMVCYGKQDGFCLQSTDTKPLKKERSSSCGQSLANIFSSFSGRRI